MIKLKALAMLAIATTLLAGCASTAAAPATVAPAAAGGTVNATLTDMKISVDKTAVAAGPVTFVVKNSGAVVHELVVLKTDVSQDKIAMGTEVAGKVDETGNVGETGDVVASGSNTFVVTLPAGHYVLICNEVGHYEAGMHMTFMVN